MRGRPRPQSPLACTDPPPSFSFPSFPFPPFSFSSFLFPIFFSSLFLFFFSLFHFFLFFPSFLFFSPFSLFLFSLPSFSLSSLPSPSRLPEPHPITPPRAARPAPPLLALPHTLGPAAPRARHASLLRPAPVCSYPPLTRALQHPAPANRAPTHAHTHVAPSHDAHAHRVPAPRAGPYPRPSPCPRACLATPRAARRCADPLQHRPVLAAASPPAPPPWAAQHRPVLAAAARIPSPLHRLAARALLRDTQDRPGAINGRRGPREAGHLPPPPHRPNWAIKGPHRGALSPPRATTAAIARLCSPSAATREPNAAAACFRHPASSSRPNPR